MPSSMAPPDHGDDSQDGQFPVGIGQVDRIVSDESVQVRSAALADGVAVDKASEERVVVTFFLVSEAGFVVEVLGGEPDLVNVGHGNVLKQDVFGGVVFVVGCDFALVGEKLGRVSVGAVDGQRKVANGVVRTLEGSSAGPPRRPRSPARTDRGPWSRRSTLRQRPCPPPRRT